MKVNPLSGSLTAAEVDAIVQQHLEERFKVEFKVHAKVKIDTVYSDWQGPPDEIAVFKGYSFTALEEAEDADVEDP